MSANAKNLLLNVRQISLSAELMVAYENINKTGLKF
jgi:hypothetical protein